MFAETALRALQAAPREPDQHVRAALELFRHLQSQPSCEPLACALAAYLLRFAAPNARAELAQWAHARLQLAPAPSPKTTVARMQLALVLGKPELALSLAERSGRSVCAAQLLEQLQRWPEAAQRWGALHTHLADDEHYLRALTAFNQVRCWLQATQPARAQPLADHCVGLLERAACAFEQAGRGERAFDCYELLSELGVLRSRYEDVLEGQLNAVRVLRHDRLHRHALERQQHLIDEAVRQGDFIAAASIAEEAALAEEQLRSAASESLRRSQLAALWSHAMQLREQLPPHSPQREQALRRTLAACVQQHDVGGAARVYRELASLPLGPEPLAHLARMQAWLGRVPERELRPLQPSSAARRATPAALWHTDLLEWEQGADAAGPCLAAALRPDRAAPLRQRALLGFALAAHAAAHPAPSWRVELARCLSGLPLYPMLAPLEALLGDRSLEVREAALRALAQLPFKRTVQRLGQELPHTPLPLHPALAVALRAMRFEHAIAPLSELLDATTAPTLLRALLEALAGIDHDDARAALARVRQFGSAAQRHELRELLGQ